MQHFSHMQFPAGDVRSLAQMHGMSRQSPNKETRRGVKSNQRYRSAVKTSAPRWIVLQKSKIERYRKSRKS